MKRNFLFWLYFVAAIILATYFATRLTMAYMGRGSGAYVRVKSVTCDMRDIDLTPISAAAAIAPGTRTYGANLDAINARVGAVPGVRTSAVRRLPNGVLAIRANMYRAVAQWTDGENFFPLSADGTIVRNPSDTRDAGAIVFRGPVPNDIADITKAAHTMTGLVDYMEWIEGRRWNLHTTGGITVMLPELDAPAAIGRLGVLHQNHNLLGKKITVIDMRDSARILVK